MYKETIKSVTRIAKSGVGIKPKRLTDHVKKG